MKVTICDACHALGVFTDLTHRNDSWRVKLTEVKMMDICAAHAPAFAEFDERRRKILNRHNTERDEAINELREEFWRKVREGGSTQESSPEPEAAFG